MTSKQERKVSGRAYKFYDEVIFENQDWSRRDTAIISFKAGAEYALKNKYDELKEDTEKNDKPNIVQFLKDNGVYEMFLANLFRERQMRNDLYEYFTHFFVGATSISSAFSWVETPEGISFWSEINSRWAKQF